MKYALKKGLKEYFEAPAPLHKKEFLQKLPQPKMNLFEFTFYQAGYIRKWIWAASAFIFVAALILGGMFPAHMLWIVSALTPFLALTILSECGRSERYEMNELEMATRFSLKSIIIARLGILGMENLLFLCLLIPVSIWKQAADPLWTGLYILTPYLLTAYIGLYIVCRFRGPETIYFCAAATICISALSILSAHDILLFGLTKGHIMWWIIIAFVLCIGTAKQLLQIINRTEELA